jgi:hypothetical protein
MVAVLAAVAILAAVVVVVLYNKQVHRIRILYSNKGRLTDAVDLQAVATTAHNIRVKGTNFDSSYPPSFFYYPQMRH